MLLVDQRGFGGAPPKRDEPTTWAEAELDRTRCAFDAGAMVGASRAYSFDLSLPGGNRVPAAAVSWVAVLPTHRRRGILTAMLGALHDDARERGEPVAILTASESAIYGRFGYGVATWRRGVSAERRAVRFVGDRGTTGRVRLVDRAEAAKLLPGLYERTRGGAGAVSRPDYWWSQVFWQPAAGDKAFFVAVHEDAAGEPDGYLAYEVTGEWHRGLPDRRLVVWDLHAVDDDARAALWRYAFAVDLVGTVAAIQVALDDPLPLLVDDPRRVRTDYVVDGLWLCPLDAAALLAARSYAIDGSLVVEVRGPDGTTARLSLDGSTSGAACAATTRSADIVCGSAALGACSLGGTSWSHLARAGLVDEHTAGALRRADLMFSTQPAPAMLTNF